MLLLTYSHFCHEAPTGVCPSLYFFEKKPWQPQRKQHPLNIFLPKHLLRTFPLTPGFYILRS